MGSKKQEITNIYVALEVWITNTYINTTYN